MELRRAEEDVQGMMVLYEAVRSAKTERIAPKLANLPELSSNLAENNEKSSSNKALSTMEGVMDALESLRSKSEELEPKTAKFRKKLGEKDPVTDAPRYGEKTRKRVVALLESYDKLQEALALAFGETEDSLVGAVQQTLTQERDAMEQKKVEEERIAREKAAAVEEARRQELRRQQEEEEAAELRRKQEEQEIARLAQESRVARHQEEQARQESEQRQREEEQRRDREWMASITKGTEGVKEQLAVLRETTNSDKESQSTAFNALHTLFSQIVAHPEEKNFRRVRRDHPKFNEDIGRHKGGREVLIAAGFRLGAIDEVPCFISTEPNIEKDMDGWSAWFDLLKGTLEAVEEELIKS